MFLERAHGGNRAAGATPAGDAAEPHRGDDDAAAAAVLRYLPSMDAAIGARRPRRARLVAGAVENDHV